MWKQNSFMLGAAVCPNKAKFCWTSRKGALTKLCDKVCDSHHGYCHFVMLVLSITTHQRHKFFPTVSFGFGFLICFVFLRQGLTLQHRSDPKPTEILCSSLPSVGITYVAPVSSFFYYFFYYLYVCVCVDVHVCIWVPSEARRQHQITWNWSYRRLWTTLGGFQELTPAPLWECYVFLTTQSSLQPLPFLAFILFGCLRQVFSV